MDVRSGSGLQVKRAIWLISLCLIVILHSDPRQDLGAQNNQPIKALREDDEERVPLSSTLRSLSLPSVRGPTNLLSSSKYLRRASRFRLCF